MSWLKWGDPVVDSGREMMMPARMLEGELLYLDHRNLYGPLAPYMNMILYKVFGVQLSVLQAAGIVSVALMAVTMYLLARRFVGRVPSTAMVVSFLYAFAFAHLTPNPSFNFVVPYAYAATYGIIAATFSLLFLVRHSQKGGDLDLVLSVAGLALTALSKLEVFLPAAAAHITWLAIARAMGQMTKRRLGVYAAGLLVTLVPYCLIAARTGSHLWTDNLAAVVNLESKGHVFETIGFDNLGASLAALGISAVALICIAAGGISAGILLRRGRSPLVRGLLIATTAMVGFLAYALLGADVALRVLPVVVVVILPVLGWRFLRRKGQRDDIVPVLLLWVFSGASLVRLGLHAGPSHYGFYLCPIPFLALGVLGFRGLPGRIGPIWKQRAVIAAGLGAIAGFTFNAFAVSAILYSEHVMDVQTLRGHMILRGEHWQPGLVAYLKQLPGGTRVVIIPQGAGLLFLADAKMAGGLYSYAPMEMSGEHTEEKIIRDFTSVPPDIVVHLAQDPGSFRYTGFGVEYGHQVVGWLRANYVPVAGSQEVTLLRYVQAKPAAKVPIP